LGTLIYPQFGVVSRHSRSGDLTLKFRSSYGFSYTECWIVEASSLVGFSSSVHRNLGRLTFWPKMSLPVLIPQKTRGTVPPHPKKPGAKNQGRSPRNQGLSPDSKCEMPALFFDRR